jgi:hypothetical protein
MGAVDFPVNESLEGRSRAALTNGLALERQLGVAAGRDGFARVAAQHEIPSWVAGAADRDVTKSVDDPLVHEDPGRSPQLFEHLSCL